MSIIIIVIIILISLYLLEVSSYIFILTNFKNRFYDKLLTHGKVFQYISLANLLVISFFTSNIFESFFPENLSYFHDLWGWFSLIGLVFIIGGSRIMYIATKLLHQKKDKLLSKSIYGVMRHPIYLALTLILYGGAIILDSITGLLLIPLIIITLEIISLLEEKCVLLVKFQSQYQTYKEKIPSRLFPNPYNYLLIIISILIAYVGILNFL
ncbi:MAG: methyltransferase family protein [Promethearchaeota archaeon]